MLVPEAEKDVEAVLGLINELGQVVSMVHANETGQLENAKARELHRLNKGSSKFVLKIPDMWACLIAGQLGDMTLMKISFISK